MKPYRFNFDYILNKDNCSIFIEKLNIPVSIKVLCDFTRRYQEETDIFENTSVNFLKEKKIVDGKTIYVYDKELNIKKKILINEFTSIQNLTQKISQNIKIYPFMKNHCIIFNYAAIIVEADIQNFIFKNRFFCSIKYELNEKLHNSSRAGTLLDRILYFGPIFRKIEDEIVKNYEVKLKIIYDYYKNV